MTRMSAAITFCITYKVQHHHLHHESVTVFGASIAVHSIAENVEGKDRH